MTAPLLTPSCWSIVGTTLMTESGVTPLGYSVHLMDPSIPTTQRIILYKPLAVGWDAGGSICGPTTILSALGLATISYPLDGKGLPL